MNQVTKIPLLLLPGMLCDHASWGAIPSALADVALPTVIDYGRADTISAMARAALAQAPETFAVAGHSMGGRVALMIQHIVPDRVVGLGLLGTSADGHKDVAARERESAQRREQLALAERVGLRGFAESWWLDRIILAERRHDRAVVQPFLRMMDRHSIDNMKAHINAGLTRPDMTDWLPEIACPTLVLAGDSDSARPPAVHQEMADKIPGATLALITGSGHMVMMERPEAVATTMREWIERIVRRAS